MARTGSVLCVLRARRLKATTVRCSQLKVLVELPLVLIDSLLLLTGPDSRGLPRHRCHVPSVCGAGFPALAGASLRLLLSSSFVAACWRNTGVGPWSGSPPPFPWTPVRPPARVSPCLELRSSHRNRSIMAQYASVASPGMVQFCTQPAPARAGPLSTITGSEPCPHCRARPPSGSWVVLPSAATASTRSLNRGLGAFRAHIAWCSRAFLRAADQPRDLPQHP